MYTHAYMCMCRYIYIYIYIYIFVVFICSLLFSLMDFVYGLDGARVLRGGEVGVALPAAVVVLLYDTITFMYIYLYMYICI